MTRHNAPRELTLTEAAAGGLEPVVPSQLAATAGPALLVAAPQAAEVDPARRIIDGMLAPYGEVGTTSAGPTRFRPGSLYFTEAARVSLNREHVRADVLGTGTELIDTPLGLRGRFRIVEGPTGDRALVEAQNGTRNGLSVEVDNIEAEWGPDGVLDVRRARVRAVAQCSVPAFDSARITSLAAALASATSPQEGPAMPCTRCHSVHAPGVTECDATVLAAVTHALTASTPAQPEPQPQPQPQPEPQPQQTTTTTTTTPVPPPSTPPSSATATTGPGLDAFARQFAAFATGQGITPELRAALSDIVPANAGEAFFRPAYAVELWDQAADVQRPFIDAITTKPLGRTMKVKAFRWVSKPEVDDYAGDKAAVPSGPASLEPVEAIVERTAGAHDIDRAYIDLGDPDFLAAYFAAMTESYREKTEAKVVAYALANATVVADGNGVAAGQAASALSGLVAGALELLALGKYPSFAAIGSGLLAELFGLTDQQAPAFFTGSLSLANATDGRVGDLRIFPVPGIPSGSMLLGTKRSVTFWEADPPVRVQALNIPNGGVDAGVFGYHTQAITDRRGIRRVDVDMTS